MIAFEIWVNGEKICTAGVNSDLGMLTSILSWTKRDVSRLPAEVRSEVSGEELKLVINGQKNLGGSQFENLQWKGRALKPGDEIRIAIIETDQADPPHAAKKIKPKFVRPKRSDIILH
jgi:hypothetical protein